jgi:hypothetical protein
LETRFVKSLLKEVKVFLKSRKPHLKKMKMFLKIKEKMIKNKKIEYNLMK